MVWSITCKKGPHDEHLCNVNLKVLMLLCSILFYRHTLPTSVTFSGDKCFSSPSPGFLPGVHNLSCELLTLFNF